VGEAKFKQYDYNHNEKIDYDEFESMLQNDYHCRIWMETLGFAAETPPEIKEKVLNQEIAKEVDELKVIEEEGDQFLAVNAWTKVAEQMSPLGAKESVTENAVPNLNLDIGYVYGYRSYDTRNNLGYNSQGDVVYHTAACGIVLNKKANTMRVSTDHNDDITCLDVNPGKGLVATGEMGKWPSLIIWDSNTLETKRIFAKKLERSIGNVAISRSGRYVAATSMSDKHEIAVYDIQKDALVAFGDGPRSVVYAIKFNAQEDEVVLACHKEVIFSRFNSGKVDLKKGVFGKAPLNPNLSIANLGDSVVTSMSSGLLVLWKGNFASKVFKEHSKSVGALCERADGGIISGDATGQIIIWSPSMSKER
jgi:echinoderm microtubule-associated protein-like 5